MKLFQSFIGNEQHQFVSPSATAFDASNNTAPDHREYEIMKNIHDQMDADEEPWGLVSWKFSHKTSISIEDFISFAQDAFDAGKECAFINPMIGNEAIFLNVWEQGINAHKKLGVITEFLKNSANLNIGAAMGKKHFAFCNYFAAKPAFWRDWFRYVDSMLEPLESEVRRGTQVGAYYSEPAGYARDSKVSMRPFVIERLFSSFLMTRASESIAEFKHDTRVYTDKFGNQLGRALLELSSTKQLMIETRDKVQLEEWDKKRQRLVREMRSAIVLLDDPSPLLMGSSQPPAHSLEALHRNKTGKVSDKWASYFPYYETLFAPISDAPLRILEIGVQNGGSLETWASYFKNAELIIGCDVNPKCSMLRYEDPRIKVVVGDANALETHRAITHISPQLDVIMDDGSHVSEDIRQSFLLYFPQLAPGGLYIVEDACCLYMNQYGGGVLNDTGAVAFFKRLADVISFEFWQDQTSIQHYLRTFFDSRVTPEFILEGWVESIEFRNSIITIRKAKTPGHNKLGKRVKAGTIAQVMNLDGARL